MTRAIGGIPSHLEDDDKVGDGDSRSTHNVCCGSCASVWMPSEPYISFKIISIVSSDSLDKKKRFELIKSFLQSTYNTHWKSVTAFASMGNLKVQKHIEYT